MNAVFEVGKTYTTRPTDYPFTVVARTAKFITIKNQYGEVNRVGVKVGSSSGNVFYEWALPFGKFSMAPVIRASREGVTP